MRRASTLLTLGLGLLCLGCADDDKDYQAPDQAMATGDAAPADVGPQPSALLMPNGLGLDLSKAATTKGAAKSVARSVSQAAGFSQELDQVVSMFLLPLEALKVPLSASTKTFSGAVTAGSGAKATQHKVKLDFGDFDADGDGTKDGCSGHTGALPICLRVWLDGQRYLAGRLDAHPTSKLAGAGRLTMVKVASLPGGEAGTAISVRYDHRKSDQRQTRSFWAVPADDPKLGQWATIRQLLVDQQGAPSTAQKTVNMTSVMPSQPGSRLQYLARYQQHKPLWYGTVVASGVFAQLGLAAFGYTCVDLTSGKTVDQAQCATQGVTFAGVAHVAAGADKDVAFPAGFAAAPTF